MTSIGMLTGHEDSVSAVAADFETSRAVSSSKDESLRIWDLATLTCIGTLAGHNRAIVDMAVDFGLARVLSCAASTLCMWDTKAMTCLQKRRANQIDVFAESQNPDTQVEVSVWDFEADRCDAFTGHAPDLLSLDANFSKLLAVSSHTDSTLRVWDLAGLRCLGTLEGHSSAARVVVVDAR